jgi:hypothetical protein
MGAKPEEVDFVNPDKEFDNDPIVQKRILLLFWMVFKTKRYTVPLTEADKLERDTLFYR